MALVTRVLYFVFFAAVTGMQATEEMDQAIHAFFTANQSSDSEKQFKGLLLIRSRSQLVPQSELEDFYGVATKGVEVPGKWGDFEEWITPYFLGKPLGEKTVQEIKKGIHLYFEKQAYPLVSVTIPPQKITQGVLQVQIEESCVGQVFVEGNKTTRSQTLFNYLSLEPGDRINEARLLDSVAFMNRNPFRRVDLVYSPGSKNFQTDITLAVQDQHPCHLSIGVDNTGIPTTGRNRYFASFSWDQFFGLDHIIFYQFTTSQNFHALMAHTLQYTAFLPNKTILNLYGGYSEVHANLPPPNRTNTGSDIQTSARYIIPLFSKLPFVHELSVGFDFKQTNNNIEYVDLDPRFAKTVNLTQWMLGYRLNANTASAFNDFSLELFASPFEWLPNQSDANFSALRPGARNQWVYLRGAWRFDYRLPKGFQFIALSRIEASPFSLLPSEQLGIGGYNSVRGYDERQLNADTGGILSFELRTPSKQIFTKRSRSLRDAALLLFFIDGGISYDETQVPAYKQWDYLLGVGPGVRYEFGSYLHGRFDLGFKLHNQDGFTGGSPMIHFSVVGSY